MADNKRTIKIDTTKRGFAAMWESGGGMTSGGSATIITGRNGERRRPIYMPRGGHLACGKHALIGVGRGFHIVHASVHHGSRESATIGRIVSITVRDIDGERFEATAEVEEVNSFDRGEWDRPLDPKFADAVKAAFHKAGSYHCRSAYFVDTSARPERSADDKQRREAEMARQDAERAKLREAKARREAEEKAAREQASRQAKAAGLGARLEAVNERLAAIGAAPYELGEVEFVRSYNRELYTEQSVAHAEQGVAQAEADHAERERKRQARELYQPLFEAFAPRAGAIGLKVACSDQAVRLGDEWSGVPYSTEGLASFEAKVMKAEAEFRAARERAAAEERYQALKAAGEAAGLPTDIRIWRRVGARTNCGNGWVIRADGTDREPTSKPSGRYPDGEIVWEQIFPGEVVLQWSKAYTAAEHHFEVVHQPDEGLTQAQRERVAEIEQSIEAEWANARGLSSGNPSPPVGNGWGLGSREPSPSSDPESDSEPVDLSEIDAGNLFGGNARVR